MENIMNIYFQKYFKDFEKGNISINDITDLFNKDRLINFYPNIYKGHDDLRVMVIFPFYKNGNVEYRYRKMDLTNPLDMELFVPISEYLKNVGIYKIEGELFNLYIPFNTSIKTCVSNISKDFTLDGFILSLNGYKEPIDIFVGNTISDNKVIRYSGRVLI